MKSTIRVDFKGLSSGLTGDYREGFEPVIRVNLQDSEDVRDGLLKSFFNKLGYNSNWLNVDISPNVIDGIKQNTQYTITPIQDNQLEEIVQIMNNRLGYSSKYNCISEYNSNFGIEDNIQFTTEKAKGTQFFNGKITAVKFTKTKVWYDILDEYSGTIFEGIPSEDVINLPIK